MSKAKIIPFLTVYRLLLCQGAMLFSLTVVTLPDLFNALKKCCFIHGCSPRACGTFPQNNLAASAFLMRGL